MAELRTLTSSRQQRVLLRLLSSAYGSASWVLTLDTLGYHCVAEGLSAPEAVRLTEDVLAAGVEMYAVEVSVAHDGQTTSTFRPLGSQDAAGRVRAYVETEELRARARSSVP